MRKTFLFCVAFIAHLLLFAQKPTIDTSVFAKWPFVDNAKISPNGKYITYSIRSSPSDSQIFASIHADWKETFSNISDADFLSNDKYAIFKTSDDSLCLLQLGTSHKLFIARTASYMLFKDKRSHEWLVYQEIEGDKKFFVRNMISGETLSENHVARYLFDELNNTILLQINKNNESIGEQSLCKWNLLTGEKKVIWKGEHVTKCGFDETGQQVAFLTDEQSKYTLWYFKEGMEQAQRWVSDTTIGIDAYLELSNEQPIFSRDGRSLFFRLKRKLVDKPKPAAVKVDIWSYKDLHLQEEQLRDISSRMFTAVISTGDKQMHRLEFEEETLNFNIDLKNCNKYLIVTKNGGNIDLWWQPLARSSVYLESVLDGSRVLLKENIPYAHDWFYSLNFSISPGEKYIVYYDPFENNYFSYEIASKITRNITFGIDVRWRGHNDRWEAPVFGYPEGIAGWLEKDSAILIYDAFDIWIIDPFGKKKPLNITNGYGLTHNTVLRLTGNSKYRKPLAAHSRLLLRAFDTENKYSGFYSKLLDRPGDPLLLTKGPYVYTDPIKAERSDIWVVLRQSVIDAPNYFYTKNWSSFTALSYVQPQREYNWMTSQLVSWTLPDNSLTQGILYKPENFNIHKKYPLLICYYEERSHELYEFKKPEVIRAEINIPYFVSRGYLVLVPDIHYKMGTPGESVVNTIISGARYLCRNSWVDSTRLGIEGHSFGGWETNYLVTHSQLFAAAAEGAGTSDLISSYGGLFIGQSRQFGYEISQGRIRSSLWQQPDLYINGSPIFRADQVTTPLLMMHNKGDEAVPWAQAVEFFTALRRLGKKVWMLQYDKGTHSVDGNDAIDYTIRMTQFFDHYLMGCAAPKWMTEGIPASRKGIDLGYELDGINKIP